VEAIPRSRIRNCWPDCVPGGIRTFTVPSNTGTSIRAPSPPSCTGHGQHDVKIVALAPEMGIRHHVHRDVEVAGRTAPGAGVTLAGEPHTLTVGNAGRQPDRHALGSHFVAGAVTRWTRPRRLLPGAPQALQLRENTMCPRTVRTAPCPWQSPHGPAAARATPAPRQPRHISRRVSVSACSQPVKLSANEMRMS
jgi:hypothetical protein